MILYPAFLLKVPAQEMAKGSMGLTKKVLFSVNRGLIVQMISPLIELTQNNTMSFYVFLGDLLTIVYFYFLLSMTKLLERFPTNHGS